MCYDFKIVSANKPKTQPKAVTQLRTDKVELNYKRAAKSEEEVS